MYANETIVIAKAMGSLYSDLSLHVQYTESILTASVSLMSEVTRRADVSD